jgi:N-acetylmuramoyl-L-alanine amidase
MLISLKFRRYLKLKNVSFVVLMLQTCLIFAQQKVIVIDIGHGGKDTGAIGINGIQEKEVVLDIGLEILRLNKTILNDGLEIYLTRYQDTFVPLAHRSRLAKNLNADVFVSLHCNAASYYSKGIEVYVFNRGDPNTKASIALGVSLLGESTEKLGFKKRGVKFANFQVLREMTAFCPAVLIETGFVTNTDEADYFLQPNNIRAMALAVLLGITNYLNTGL